MVRAEYHLVVEGDVACIALRIRVDYDQHHLTVTDHNRGRRRRRVHVPELTRQWYSGHISELQCQQPVPVCSWKSDELVGCRQRRTISNTFVLSYGSMESNTFLLERLVEW